MDNTRNRSRRGLLLAGLVIGAASLAACSGGSSDGATDGATPSSTAVDSGSERGSFSALSYNVAGLPAEISKERPDVNLPLISPKLEAYDLVLTQEDFDWWKPDGLASTVDFVNYHDRLRADVTHEYQSDVHPGPEAVGLDLSVHPDPELGDGLGILSRMPITEAIRVPWTSCFGGIDTSDGGAADCLAMKGFAMTRMTLADGMVVDVYDLHGEAGGSETDQQLQADGYVQLADYIVENSEGHAIVLGGDTNLHTGSDHEDGADGADTEIWSTFLEATGLTDACAAVECDDDTRIDKFAFRSGEGVDLEVEDYGFRTEEFVDDAGEDLSDHQALEVVFGWKRA